MHHFAVGDRAHFIDRLALRIALHGPDIDPFVEARVNQPAGSRDRIAHKTVLSALPWSGFLAAKIAQDVLVKLRAAAVEERVIRRG